MLPEGWIRGGCWNCIVQAFMQIAIPVIHGDISKGIAIPVPVWSRWLVLIGAVSSASDQRPIFIVYVTSCSSCACLITVPVAISHQYCRTLTAGELSCVIRVIAGRVAPGAGVVCTHEVLTSII